MRIPRFQSASLLRLRDWLHRKLDPIRGFRKVLLVLGLVSLGGFLWDLSYREILPQWSVRASSVPQGTYQRVIHAMAGAMSNYEGELKFKIYLTNVPSAGSRDTLSQLASNRVDLGIVQGNAPLEKRSGGVILALYDEVYLLFTRRSEQRLDELIEAVRKEGRPVKVACLGPGSQSAEDAKLLLQYFGARTNDYRLLGLSYPESQAAILSGQVDVALFVTGMGSPVIRDLAQTEGVNILPLAEHPAITNLFRGVECYTIAPGTFRSRVPEFSVETLATPALLMAGPVVRKRSARRLAYTLLSHRWEIEKQEPFMRIRPVSDQFKSLLHPGVLEQMDEPTKGWINSYSEHIKLFLGLPTSIATFITLWRLIRRREEKALATASDHQHDGAV